MNFPGMNRPGGVAAAAGGMSEQEQAIVRNVCLVFSTTLNYADVCPIDTKRHGIVPDQGGNGWWNGLRARRCIRIIHE